MLVVRAAVLKNYIEVATQYGLNADQMLRDVSLTRAQLADPENAVPMPAVLTLLELSARRSNCATFGLHMAQNRQLSDFGVASLLISHQRTLRDALLTTIEYRHLLNQTLILQLEEAGKTIIVREELVAEPGQPTRQATELAVAILYRMCSALIGPSWLPRSVSFAHSAPADGDRSMYQKVFRCRVDFDSDFSGFVCNAADLDAPNPKADPAMASYARRFMDENFRPADDAVIFDVRKAIYLLMPMGRATIEQTADGLGMSVRTLQRQLDAHGLSFSSLLNDVRRELVLRYMENRRYSLQRVALLLGYAVPSSFTRWFASEFGMAPRTWRNQAASRPPAALPSADAAASPP